ncbi:MAG: hypothetical protein QOG33_826, partial [Gaiellales bacterium]|nr:hypothetical protein [Gaiellales bacterium]
PALPVFALITGIVLAVRRAPQLTDRLRRPSKVLVPIALWLLTANSGVELWLDATEIL